MTASNMMISMLLALALLVVFPTHSSRSTTRFIEGGPAEFRFTFHNDINLQVQVGIDDRPPFYMNGHLNEAGLSRSQFERFQVETSTEMSHVLSVHIKIHNVSREDTGTFVCKTFAEGEYPENERKQMYLSVEYPPGKVSCSLEPPENYVHLGMGDMWAILVCRAPLGTQPGFISCYQLGEQLPPWTIPVSNSSVLQQKIWMKVTLPTFCCSSSFERKKAMDTCDDFALEPVIPRMNHDQEDSTDSTSFSLLGLLDAFTEPSTGEVFTEHYRDPCCRSNKFSYMIVAGLLILIPVVCILLAMIVGDIHALQQSVRK